MYQKEESIYDFIHTYSKESMKSILSLKKKKKEKETGSFNFIFSNVTFCIINEIPRSPDNIIPGETSSS